MIGVAVAGDDGRSFNVQKGATMQISYRTIQLASVNSVISDFIGFFLVQFNFS